MPDLKVIISGGGTGGHIFPAIAIANSIRDLHPNADILFIGARGKMEMEKVPKAGYPIKGLWISGIQRRLTIKNLSFPFKLISSLWNAYKILSDFKPDVVIGVGGYASGPTLRMAIRKKIPTLIQEQNSYPGITNRLLGSKVDKICVAYEGLQKYFPADKIILTGNPIRESVKKIEGKKSEALSHFGLKEEQQTLLIIGGSQGARSINKAVKKHFKNLLDKQIQIIWQTGIPFYEEAVNAEGADQKGIKIHTFINEMDLAYAAADIIVSRAGAIAISEIIAVAKPSIFVPLPSAAEDHQKKNAMALVEKDAAMIIEDFDVCDKLYQMVSLLAEDKDIRERYSKNIKEFDLPDAAQKIAAEALRLIAKGKK